MIIAALVYFFALFIITSQNKKLNLLRLAAVVNAEPVEVWPTAEVNAIKKELIEKALHKIIYRIFLLPGIHLKKLCSLVVLQQAQYSQRRLKG